MIGLWNFPPLFLHFSRGSSLRSSRVRFALFKRRVQARTGPLRSSLIAAVLALRCSLIAALLATPSLRYGDTRFARSNRMGLRPSRKLSKTFRTWVARYVPISFPRGVQSVLCGLKAIGVWMR